MFVVVVIIFYIKLLEYLLIRKNGVVLSEDSGSYIDVDFYIFIPSMLNEKIMAEQLSIGKEVMIIMEDADDISIVISFLENNRNNKENYQYITNHAKIFYYSV